MKPVLIRLRSKLRKLRRDPRVFVADAIRRRVPHRPSQRPRPPSEHPVPLSSEAILARLVEICPVLLSAHESRFELGVLETDLPSMLRELLCIAQSHSLKLVLKAEDDDPIAVSEIASRTIRYLRSTWRANVAMESGGLTLMSVDLLIYRWRDETYVTGPQATMQVLPRTTALALARTSENGLRSVEQLLDPSCPNTESSDAIDVVYSWVNAGDAEWRRLYSSNVGPIEEADLDRFISRDELRYSLRSIYQNADWVRQIYIVSNCRPPAWLDVTHSRINWVCHGDILGPDCLPTFNSHAIEAAIHRTPSIGKRFLYLNDDFFIVKPVRRRAFFDRHGRSKVFLEDTGRIARSPRRSGGDWYESRLYAQALLLHRYGVVATRLLEHAPYAVDRDLCDRIANELESEIERTKRNRTRSSTDLALMPLVYGYRALSLGRAVEAQAACQTINILNYKDFTLSRSTEFLCVNDGGGSSARGRFGETLENLLAMRFPHQAPWETSPEQWY